MRTLSFVLLLALCLALPHAAAQEYVAAEHVFAFGYASPQPVSGEPQQLVLDVYDNATGIPAGGLAGSLKLEIRLSDASKAFPLVESETVVGRYVATFLPTRPGNYTAHLTGRVGDAEIDVVAELPPVADESALAFPTPPLDARIQEIEQRIETKGMPFGGLALVVGALALVALSRRSAGGRR